MNQTSQSDRVLLAEDDNTLRKMLSIHLKNLGYEVIEAEDGEKALSLSKEHGALQLLITDIMMPGMHGIELTRKLRKKHRRLPILFITGYAGIWNAELENLEQDSISIINKPFSLHEITEKLEGLLKAAGDE